MDEQPDERAADESTEEPVTRAVAARWPLATSRDTLFANNILAQHQDGMFIVSFGLVLPPSPYTISREEFQRLSYVDVDVVARVALTPATMRDVIGVLSENYRKWEARQGQPTVPGDRVEGGADDD